MKQPRVPEYREADGVKAYIKPLILFLKDFTMAAWTANNQRKKEIEAVRKDIPTLPEVNYPVTSVNKKTGDVVLSVQDVGALAADGTAKDAEKLGGKAPDEFASAAQAVPVGGSEGQVLAKATDADNDLLWMTPAKGVEMVLLWENASPTSNFGSQTMEVPGMSECNSVLIIMTHNRVNANTGQVLPVQFWISRAFAGGVFYMTHTRSGTDGMYTCRREVTPNFDEETMKWSGAVQQQSESRNDRMVPLQLIGIKGVSA